MNVKKSALYTGNYGKHKYLIEQLEDNSIRVTADSTKAQLRLLAKHCGFDYDDNWNTRTLGAKFIDFLHEKDPNSVMLDDNAKKMAIVLDKDEQGNLFKHTIEQSANSENENTITVTADSKKAVLRLIFNDMGVKYDNDWTTNQMGAKLIELINNSSDDEYDDKPLESEIIAEKNWEWWLSLDKNMRFLILYQYHDELQDEYEEDEDGVLEIYYDEELQTDESGYIHYLISDYMESLEEIDVSAPALSHEESVMCLNDFGFQGFEQLAYLPNLTELRFEDMDFLHCMPKGLDKLSKLKNLSLYSTLVGDDEPDTDFETLIQIAKSIPNLECLELRSTPLADWLDENPDKFDELKSLLPNCNIKV